MDQSFQMEKEIDFMNVYIYSRMAMEKLLKKGVPQHTAIISFYDPPGKKGTMARMPINYAGKAKNVFQEALYDIDLVVLPKYNLTYETYFPEADELAEFIFHAKEKQMDIICQCEYGESRSSGCAAAIMEYFYRRGIEIFTDYRYYPNQLVYHKVYDALDKYGHCRENR